MYIYTHIDSEPCVTTKENSETASPTDIPSVIYIYIYIIVYMYIHTYVYI